jgi:hypothetical protein
MSVSPSTLSIGAEHEINLIVKIVGVRDFGLVYAAHEPTGKQFAFRFDSFQGYQGEPALAFGVSCGKDDLCRGVKRPRSASVILSIGEKQCAERRRSQIGRELQIASSCARPGGPGQQAVLDSAGPHPRCPSSVWQDDRSVIDASG